MAREKQVGRPENTSSDGEPEVAAVWVRVAELTPWVRNPRKNDHVVADVAKSIKRFGFGAPLLARKANGEIIAGHTRLKAAVQLGLDRVPVRYLDLDPAEAHLLALADNRLNEKAEWDNRELAELLAEFGPADADLAGWGADDLEQIVGKLGVAELDPAEAIGALPTGDREPYRQMTFTLHDSQAEAVEAALQRAKDAGPFVDEPNENSNGNALARICEAYLG